MRKPANLHFRTALGAAMPLTGWESRFEKPPQNLLGDPRGEVARRHGLAGQVFAHRDADIMEVAMTAVTFIA